MSTSLSTPLPGLPGGAPLPAAQQPVPLAPETAAAPTPDFDDAALTAARRAADLEDGQRPAQQPAPVQQPTGTQPAPQPGAQPIMIPKERLDEALAAARTNGASAEEWRNRALYMEGALATARAQPAAAPQPGTQPPAPQPVQATIEQQILAQQNAMIEAAGKFDRGEILATDLTRIQIAAQNAIAALREGNLARWVQTQVPTIQPGIADAQILDTATFNLEQRHPWCAQLKPLEWNWLENWGIDFFAKTGAPITTGNTADALRLRAFMAQMTDVLGPWLYPSRIAQVEAQRFAQRQQPQPGVQQPAALPGQQPAAAPLQRFANHPPNLAAAGTAGSDNEINEGRIATMTTDEIEALPAAVRARYM
jgi:hypothetical protein